MEELKLIKIFIVDDEKMVVERLKEMLPSSEGFDYVGSADSGERAIEMLKNKPVDIVLMDQDFGVRGDLSGIQAGEKLCEIFFKYPKNKRPNLVFITKHNDYNITNAASQLKASLIGKSVERNRLIMYLKMIHEDGARIENPDPKGPPSPDRTQGLGIAIQQLLKDEDKNEAEGEKKKKIDLMAIAKKIRRGLTSPQIQKELGYSRDDVENGKRKIYRLLSPLLVSEEMNISVLSVLMERSGLCPPLQLNDINKVLKEKK